MSNWQKNKLGEVCDILSSKRIFAKEYVSEGVPFFRGKEIIEKQKGNKVSTELFITRERYEELKSKSGVPSKGDILLTSVGTLGVPWVVTNEKFYFKDGNLTWFRNFNDIDSTFLYYWILSPKAKEQIDQKCIGSTQRALTIETLRKFELNLPPLEEQRRIADVLSSLDDKIELNNRINKNLESQASALFKRWFVDFEFPDPSGNPYKSAGGKFIDSPMGKIPEGWRVGKLSDLICIKYGKDHKKLNDGMIPVYGSGGVMRYVDCVLYDKESVLIPRKGTLNNITYINTPFWSVDTMFFSEMKQPNVAKVIYFFLKEKDMASMNAGSAVPSMTTEILNSMPIIVADEKIYQSYDNVVSEMFSAISNNTKQNERLAQMRDSLLPKLMNNEI